MKNEMLKLFKPKIRKVMKLDDLGRIKLGTIVSIEGREEKVIYIERDGLIRTIRQEREPNIIKWNTLSIKKELRLNM